MRHLLTACAMAAAIATPITPAAALEELRVCVTIGATGKSFRISPLIDTGESLNAISGTKRFEPEATYVIVPWSNGAESVIRIEDAWPRVDGSKGEDLEGNSWIVSTDVENCR